MTAIVKRVAKTIIRAHWTLLPEVIPPVTSNATILLSRPAPITMGAAQRVVIPSQIITATPFVEITCSKWENSVTVIAQPSVQIRTLALSTASSALQPPAMPIAPILISAHAPLAMDAAHLDVIISTMMTVLLSAPTMSSRPEKPVMEIVPRPVMTGSFVHRTP